MAGLVVALGVALLAGLGRGAVLAGRRQAPAWRLSVRTSAGSGGSSVGAPAALVAVGQRWWRERPRRWRRALADDLPGVLDDVGRSLRAGATLRQALGEAAHAHEGPAAQGLAEVVVLAERGLPLTDALQRWSRAAAQPEVDLAVAALALAADEGGGAARVVDAVAATLRERRAAMQEIDVQSVQARLSAVVIALLPLVFTTWCVATDDRAATFLLASPAGWLCLVAGLGLLAGGAGWMVHIVRSVS